MKSKIVLIIILAAAIVCVLGVRVYNGHLFFFDMPDRSGWTGEGNDLRYLDRHAGIVKDRLLKIDNETYYFGSDGSVAKGEIELGGFVYYFDERTGHMQTGWKEKNGKRYYYEENGHKVIGLSKPTFLPLARASAITFLQIRDVAPYATRMISASSVRKAS